MFGQQIIQGSFRGFSGLGDSASERPTIDYVRKGDVIRVFIAINPDWYFGGSGIGAKFTQLLQNSFNIASPPSDVSSTFGQRAWTVDVQPRSDYSKIGDVVSTVLGKAQTAGLSVSSGTSYGQFVSRAEDTGGGKLPLTIVKPKTDGTDPNEKNSFQDFIDSLTKSPVTLAVILGAAVVLVIAAKK